MPATSKMSSSATDPNNNKKPRLDNYRNASDDNKDAVVVVGGKEFEDDSHYLCYLSDYFRGAFRSGMKESKTLRFEFPDKDPDEWETFRAACQPLATDVVTMENVVGILKWCNQLCVPKEFWRGPERIYWEKILNLTLFEISMKKFQKMSHEAFEAKFVKDLDFAPEFCETTDEYLEEVDEEGTWGMLDALEESLELNLDLHVNLVERILGICLREYPYLLCRFARHEKRIHRLLGILRANDNRLDDLWKSVRAFLPPSLQEKSRTELLSIEWNEVMWPLLVSLVKKHWRENVIGYMENQTARLEKDIHSKEKEIETLKKAMDGGENGKKSKKGKTV